MRTPTPRAYDRCTGDGMLFPHRRECAATARQAAAAAERRRPVMSRRPLRVVIVGAGIGGLAAAVALRQRGVEVSVYERSAKLEEVGAGIQVGPNAVKVLRALGLAEELRRHAFEPTNIV